MKKVIIDKNLPESEVMFSEISEYSPIFAKRDGKLCGMIVNERDKGWILKIGGTAGATGNHPTLEECIESCLPYRYEFYVE